MKRLKSLVKSKLKKRENREKGEETGNTSLSNSGAVADVANGHKTEEGHNQTRQDNKVESKRSKVQHTNGLKTSSGCTEENHWNSTYPSLPKPLQVKANPGTSRTENQVSEEELSTIVSEGATGFQQSECLERQTPDINRHNQSSVRFTNKQSPQIDMQEASGSVNPRTLRGNPSQAEQQEGQNDTPRTSTPTGVQAVTDLMSQMTVNDNFAQRHENLAIQEVAAPPDEPLVSSLQENHSLMERISLMLNPHNQVIKNWEGLAHELRAPQKIRAQCKRVTDHSQTRMLFEALSTSAATEDLRVNQLIAILNGLGRKDVVDLLQRNISETERGNRVAIEVTSNDELMEKLETMLDKKSRVIKNWYHLGLKLGLSKDALQGIKDGDRPKGLPEFFEYIYSRFPKLSVLEFKGKMTRMNRRDIVDALEGVPQGLMKDSIPLHSDEMRKLCYCLGQNCCGTVKDWKHLAIELNIDYQTYKAFDKEIPESPASILIEWALTEKPGMTIQDLCKHFKNMKRYDVIEEIEKSYDRSFAQS